MKKTYIIPKALTVRLNTSNIIAASPVNITGDSGTATLNDFQTESGAEVLVKGDVNIWDDEW
ncbi:MAG: hypothetical protein K6G92_10860 [Bacteroidaceae bacterium]|nr:hypothetical protein [Bacteroidaceae bacterium]